MADGDLVVDKPVMTGATVEKALTQEQADVKSRTADYEKAVGSEVSQLDRVSRELRQANAPLESLRAGLNPPKYTPVQQLVTKETNPIQMWSSMAMLVAALGSLKARVPLVAAMNAAGAAIQGFHQRDYEKAQQAFETWKVESENARNIFQSELETYRAILGDIEHKEGLNVQEASSKRQNIVAQANAVRYAYGATGAQEFKTVGQVSQWVKDGQTLAAKLSIADWQVQERLLRLKETQRWHDTESQWKYYTSDQKKQLAEERLKFEQDKLGQILENKRDAQGQLKEHWDKEEKLQEARLNEFMRSTQYKEGIMGREETRKEAQTAADVDYKKLAGDVKVRQELLNENVAAYKEKLATANQDSVAAFRKATTDWRNASLEDKKQAFSDRLAFLNKQLEMVLQDKSVARDEHRREFDSKIQELREQLAATITYREQVLSFNRDKAEKGEQNAARRIELQAENTALRGTMVDIADRRLQLQDLFGRMRIEQTERRLDMTDAAQKERAQEFDRRQTDAEAALHHTWEVQAEKLAQTKDLSMRRLAYGELDKAVADYEKGMNNWINSDKILNASTRKIVQDDLKSHISAAQDFIKTLKEDVERRYPIDGVQGESIREIKATDTAGLDREIQSLVNQGILKSKDQFRWNGQIGIVP